MQKGTLSEQQKITASHIAKQCENEIIAQEVIRQLTRKWGSPKITTINEREIVELFNENGKVIGYCGCFA